MTLRWNSSIAALALLALTCMLASSSASLAEEQGAQKLAAGPGDGASPGDADTAPGDTSDTGPAAEPGDDQAPTGGAETGKDTGAPGAEELASPKDAAPETGPAERAEEPTKGEEEQAAPA